jgi:hypothetical protein
VPRLYTVRGAASTMNTLFQRRTQVDTYDAVTIPGVQPERARRPSFVAAPTRTAPSRAEVKARTTLFFRFLVTARLWAGGTMLFVPRPPCAPTIPCPRDGSVRRGGFPCLRLPIPRRRRNRRRRRDDDDEAVDSARRTARRVPRPGADQGPPAPWTRPPSHLVVGAEGLFHPPPRGPLLVVPIQGRHQHTRSASCGRGVLLVQRTILVGSGSGSFVERRLRTLAGKRPAELRAGSLRTGPSPLLPPARRSWAVSSGR